MALHALKIVKEEIAKAYQSVSDWRGTALDVLARAENHRLDELQMKIIHRIEKECIDQPEPVGVSLLEYPHDDDIPF